MDTIGGFRLTNKGGFVCAGKVQYIDDHGSTKRTARWHWISLGQSEDMMGDDLAQKGVPAGALIQMYIEIQAGDDRTGGRYFRWDQSSTACAEYSITGTTLNSSVHFDGIKIRALDTALRDGVFSQEDPIAG